jgi:hypothetical protein
MSDTNEFEETTDGFKNLRAAYNKLKTERDAAVSEASTLKAQVRTRSIGDKLGELGINSKISRFIPADVELDKLDSWLGENADVFGIDLTPKSDDPSAEEQAQSRLSGLEGTGSSLPSGDAQQAAAVSQMSQDDLLKAIFNAQMGK